LSPRRTQRYSRRRRLQFTKEGKYFVGLTFAIGFAAINTSNNLLYLVLGMLLSLIIGSGILSEISLKRLAVTRQPPEHYFAARPFLMGITLTNEKSRFASFSVEVEEVLEEQPMQRKCYFLKVPAGRTQRTSYRHTFDRRGLYTLTGVTLRTRFPFGLFQKSARVASACEVLVYPRVYPLPLEREAYQDGGEGYAGRAGRHGEYHTLRDYRVGDDPRTIAWKASARQRRILAREYEDPRSHEVLVFFDNAASAPLSPSDIDRQEQAVSEAASLAAHFVERGFRVGLRSHSSDLRPQSGPAQLHRILKELALIDFVEPEQRKTIPSGPHVIIVAIAGGSGAQLVAAREVPAWRENARG
jgi:uncharacterized protein (DUF58 family)